MNNSSKASEIAGNVPGTFPTMPALILTDAGLQLHADHPTPQPGPGEALLAVHLAGICSTDVELTRGYKGGFRGVLGHEAVGTVVAAPGAPAWLGRRAVSEINIGCGACDLCRQGLGKHCQQRTCLGIANRDGVFARYVAVPIANLHAVPDHVSDEQAVFTEPLAAAFEILEQVTVTPQTRVYVQGDGRLGLLCALVLATTGCDLTVVGRHPQKLAILQAAGITQVRLSAAATYAELGERPADVVVEATGHPAGFAAALDLVRPLGTLVLKSTFADKLDGFDISRVVVDEITLVGSRCGPFDKALAALASGAIDVRPLIHARYGLSEGLAAFAKAQGKGVLKVLIDPRV